MEIMTNIFTLVAKYADVLLRTLIPKGLKTMDKPQKKTTLYRLVFAWIALITLFGAVYLGIIDWITVEDILRIILPYSSE